MTFKAIHDTHDPLHPQLPYRIEDNVKRAMADVQFDVVVGITDVDAAIAETGSIIISTGTHRSRGSYLSPPVHIALVYKDQFLADIVDYFSRTVDALEMPNRSATVLISGPSKTADIEGILITGVHGPATVYVLIIDDRYQSD